MQSKKKLIIWGSIVLAVIFIVGTGFAAFDGPYPHFGRGFHGKNFSGYVLKRFDAKIEKLNLSSSQQEHYEQLKETLAVELKMIAENRAQFRAAIKQELEAENPDIEKIAGLIKAKVGQMQSKVGNHIDDLVGFYGILDDEQKSLVVEDFRKKMNRFSGCRFAGEGDDDSQN
jgi:hypothetical protein